MLPRDEEGLLLISERFDEALRLPVEEARPDEPPCNLLFPLREADRLSSFPDERFPDFDLVFAILFLFL